ncbi:fucose 4-O-acetylase-like acetyltransferase [Sphingomonas sp. BK036]|uniref:acyltransferase family protein n=1 Tax=Sphingomonas sp. BK036 TaxID=2512122 RepID=UPI00102957B2|nr:acyltransferase family protein [Sphingomonas sp. BK036]RZT44896.1 fucose 4-O-acetylase-like acetyltransferase [Sphingomonas sp. BK036]
MIYGDSSRNLQRLAWLDIARGVGIILVVAGHVERGLVASGIATGSAWSIFDVGLYTFHMPLFMLLAGMNVNQSLGKGKSCFIRSKINSVLLPYVIWSLIQGSLLVILSGSTNNATTWIDVLSIGWKPISPFWFLYALFLYFCIAAISSNKIVLLAFGVSGIILADSLEPGSFANLLCHHLLFFVIGVAAGDFIKNWNPSRPAIVILTGVLGYYLGWQVLASGKTAYTSLSAIPCALMGSIVVLATARMVDKSAFYLEWIGLRSMPIYVMHIIAASGSRVVLEKLGITTDVWVFFVVGVVSGVGFPLLAYTIMIKLGVSPLFGLSDRPKKVDTRQIKTASRTNDNHISMN